MFQTLSILNIYSTKKFLYHDHPDTSFDIFAVGFNIYLKYYSNEKWSNIVKDFVWSILLLNKP